MIFVEDPAAHLLGPLISVLPIEGLGDHVIEGHVHV